MYIRFRLSLSKQDALEFIRSEENLSNDVIQAVFSKVELYDIRINDRRETDSKVLQDIEDNKHSTLLKFNKVHFFFMTDIHDKVSNGNFERMDSRILEADKWNSYIENFTTNTEIAYHWKKKADKDFESFEVFYKDICNNRNYWKILWYFFIVINLGAIGSLFASINFPLNHMDWDGGIVVLIMTIVDFLIFVMCNL